MDSYPLTLTHLIQLFSVMRVQIENGGNTKKKIKERMILYVYILFDGVEVTMFMTTANR